LQHDRTRRDAAAVTDFDVPKTCAPHRSIRHHRSLVTIVFFASTAKRNQMQHRDIVASNCRFTDHDGMRRLIADAPADLRSRMNVDAKRISLVRIWMK
jgi:hypothetical protein